MCAADSATALTGKNTGCLRLLKDDNPRMLAVRYVIRTKNLVAKNIAFKLHEILDSVIKYINSIKTNAKSKSLFKKFREAGRRHAHGFHYTSKLIFSSQLRNVGGGLAKKGGRSNGLNDLPLPS